MPRIQVRRVAVALVEAGEASSLLPPDGRQSGTALMVRRGVCRHLRAAGFAALAEFPLPNGRRADLVAVSPEGGIAVVEIKSSVEDLRSDGKWPDYLDYCDCFSFATAPHVPADIFPEDAGLLVADRYGAQVLREAECRPLAAARRKAMLIRFGQLAAHRLHALDDPEGARGAC
jgi:hypothetical protein